VRQRTEITLDRREHEDKREQQIIDAQMRRTAGDACAHELAHALDGIDLVGKVARRVRRDIEQPLRSILERAKQQ
jgi:hypothetical protein